MLILCLSNFITTVLLQMQQQLEDARATLHGLVMHIVMISITTWAAAMMEGTVVDVTLTRNTAQSADALTQMEAGVEQLAHQLLQLHQLLLPHQLLPLRAILQE
jgi:hypothetical protein